MIFPGHGPICSCGLCFPGNADDVIAAATPIRVKKPRTPRWTVNTCGKCNGLGWVTPAKTCPRCKGTGKAGAK